MFKQKSYIPKCDNCKNLIAGHPFSCEKTKQEFHNGFQMPKKCKHFKQLNMKLIKRRRIMYKIGGYFALTVSIIIALIIGFFIHGYNLIRMALGYKKLSIIN